MPSDFVSLLSTDIDLNSPKSLYSKESVYDLLPKELQLPPNTQDKPSMSQKSGGEAGPLPSAALASDAATPCVTSSSPGGHSSALPASSCPSMHSATSAPEQSSRLHTCLPSEVLGVEPGSTSTISGAAGGDGVGVPAHQSQMTPSKRRTVLNISPPPEDLLDDSRMSCQDELVLNPDSEQSSSIWMDDSVSNFSMLSSSSYNDNSEVPRKSRKRTPRQRPGPKPVARDEATMDVFDADSAKAPHFVLSQLGSEAKGNLKVSSLDVAGSQKGGILSMQYPQKSEGKELKILVQPETQHRARYLTEGSRGSVKDRTQQGFPTVKLEGVNEPVMLQVFVANDAGRVKPHGFYQACRVTGRNTTACKEVDIEGTTVIEVNLEPTNSMTLAVDCVGILKLRNADVEARIGVAGSKKKSTRARLAFRVNIPRPDGSVLTLQTLSSPILCTQPAGVPEILKKSLHSCPVIGGEEIFIIGKNFLKGTKVIFQENATDDSSWQAEAEIDMELFHQNHLVVKVPPYCDLMVTSPVSVGISVVTNAGRTHELQPFTYTPQPEKVDISVKSELPAAANPCTFEDQLKAMQTGTSSLNSTLMAPMISIVKREEVTPMEVSTNPTTSSIFKPAEMLNSNQPILEITTVLPTSSKSFPSPVPLPAVHSQQSAPPIFAPPEPLTTIQNQDISPTSFQVSLSEDATVLQPVPAQVPQQFLRETPETLSPEDNSPDGTGMVVVGIEPRAPPSQQPQVQTLLPQDEVAQLERAVRELQEQQHLNSVLYGPNPSAESLQQHVQENMNSLRLGGNENTLTNQQQQHQEQTILENLQQQHQKALVDLQHQQTVLENLQQQQKVLENLQQQALENLQQQALENLQQQQSHHKVLENLQHQKVLENIQQQNTLVNMQHQKVFDNLQQQQHHQNNLEKLQQEQHQEVLENLQKQLQSELLQPQIPMQCTPSFSGVPQGQMSEPPSTTQTDSALSQPSDGFLQNPGQQSQQQALFQQAGGLLTIQTSSFLQQTPSQSSPPQQLYQSHSPMTETQDPQTALFGTSKPSQVQPAIFPNTMSMLTTTNLSPDQQAPSATLFISQGVLPSQITADNTQNQQQQIAFLAPIQTSASAPQTVSLFQGQPQLTTSMDQPAPQPQQIQTPQQASLFQNMSTISQGQGQQQPQTGLLFCATPLNSQDLPQTLLFSSQNQGPIGGEPLPQNIFQDQQPMQVVPSTADVTVDSSTNQTIIPPSQSTQNPQILFPQATVVNVAQQDSSEPMSFQDESSVVGEPSASMPSSQPGLFQDQQPMQVVPSAGSVASISSTEQASVNIFLPQAAISALQSAVGTQKMPQAATAAATIFSGQGGVTVGGLQSSTSASSQPTPDPLFQTSGSNLNQSGQPGQTGLFLFEIPTECVQLLNPPGPVLTDQLVTMGHPSDHNQLQTSTQIHTLLDQQSNSISEKIDELLEQFQEQGKTLPRDFLDQ